VEISARNRHFFYQRSHFLPKIQILTESRAPFNSSFRLEIENSKSKTRNRKLEIKNSKSKLRVQKHFSKSNFASKNILASRGAYSSALQFMRAPNVLAWILAKKRRLCISTSMAKAQFVGFGMLALQMELNSVFLHTRSILLHMNLRNRWFYKLNSVLNLVTMIIFRAMVSYKMLSWFQNTDSSQIGYHYYLGIGGCTVIAVMSAVLFLRCIYSDYFRNN